MQLMKSNIQGFNVDNNTAQYYLDKYTPQFMHGDNFTFNFGLNFGF